MLQADRREAWSGRYVDTQDLCSPAAAAAGQRAAATVTGDMAAARCTAAAAAGVASLPADIPFVFRHWNADDASPWHVYMLQYRAEYTYRRLGVTQTSSSADSCSATVRPTTRRPLRDARTEHYSVDSALTDGQSSSTHCQRGTAKFRARAGHRSAPASFTATSTRPPVDHDDDDDDDDPDAVVSVMTVALDRGTTAAKSLLHCPAVRIHLNGGSSSFNAAPHAPSASLLPRVVTDCVASRTHHHHHHHHHHHQQQQQHEDLSLIHI